jgi:hypothetical protein
LQFQFLLLVTAIGFDFILQLNISPKETEVFFQLTKRRASSRQKYSIDQQVALHTTKTAPGHQSINGPRHHEIQKPGCQPQTL